MTENNHKQYEQEEKQENKRLAGIVTGGIAFAIIFGLLISNILNLGIAKYRVGQLESRIETLEEKNKSLKDELLEAQIRNIDLENELANTQAELDTRDEEIAVYEESLEEMGQIADEINTYIGNIKDILCGEAAD